MATKRMISKEIMKNTEFIHLSSEAKALYFLLNLEADDNGFTEPFYIMQIQKINKEALIELARKKFITLFLKITNGLDYKIEILDNESKLNGVDNFELKNIYVSVIKDWFHHNSISKSYFKPSQYKEEMRMLTLNENSQIIPITCEGQYCYLDIQLENDNFLNKTYIENRC